MTITIYIYNTIHTILACPPQLQSTKSQIYWQLVLSAYKRLKQILYFKVCTPSSKPSWKARFCNPLTFSISWDVVRLPNSGLENTDGLNPNYTIPNLNLMCDEQLWLPCIFSSWDWQGTDPAYVANRDLGSITE